MGLLAETNASIREAEDLQRRRKLEEDRFRKPVAVIDRLQHDLEELNLRGQKRVPLSFEARLREIESLVAGLPRLEQVREDLRVKIGIGKLMDALFALEEALFEQRYGRSFDPEPNDHDTDLIPAA
jgi:hypothetical protein